MNIAKVVITGPGAVGKTATCIMYTSRNILKAKNLPLTIGFNFFIKSLEKENITLQIWDLAGQARFGLIRTPLYSDSFAIIVMIDMSNKHSFEYTQVLLKEELFPFLKKNKVPCIFLVGNKIDLPNEIDDTHLEKLSLMIKEQTNIPVALYKMCAFNQSQVDNLFSDVVNCIIQNKISVN